MAGKIPGQTADVVNPAEPPTSIGGDTTMGAGNGSFDPQKSPTTASKGSPALDVTQGNRPQSEARKENAPNPQEIPAGGAVLKADPTPASRANSAQGGVMGVSKTPFKSLK